MKRDPRNTAAYQECLKLFIERKGEDVAAIERLMREVYGHRNFHRRILYGRYKDATYKPGWIDRFGWKTLIPDPTSLESGLPDKPSGSERAGKPASKLENKMRLREWLERVSPGMNWHWRHLRLIQEYLELVTKGELKRLMIFMPPRHGKSELVTVRYAAKRLADDPSMNVIIGSYNQRLANRFSRKVRRVLADARNADTPVRMAASSAETRALSEPPASAGGQIVETQSRRGCASCSSSSPTGTNNIAQGKAAGRHPGYKVPDQPLPEGEQQHNNTTVCTKCGSSSPRLGVSAVQTFRPANSLEEWETQHGGGVRAVGVGAGVTGYGASLIIIDDPVKNRAEAESKTYRDKVWDWFNDDISTRLEPDGAMILIQTRGHEDDLAGRLIKEMVSGGEEWDILALPAIAEGDLTAETQSLEAGLPALSFPESLSGKPDSKPVADQESGIWTQTDPLGRKPGEALCPERFNITELEKMRRKLGSYSFSALYQQRPTPIEGGLFKRAWFMNNVVEKLPVGVKLVRAYDLAVSTRTTADYTASVLGGFDNRGNFYIADIMRRRLEFPEQKRFILDRMMREPHIQHGVELALHGQAIIQDLRRFAPTRAVALKGIRVETDKVTRALTWAALAEERKLFLVRGPWLREFVEEVCSFPNSKHDDQVDAVSLAVSMTNRHKYRHAVF